MKGHDDIDRILAQRHWLRGLARSLARTEVDAEDLAQGTLAAALAGPVPPLRSPRAWLGQIARNLSTKGAARDRARRAREEDVSRTEATDSAARSAASMETFSLLSRLVLDLDEPYRTVITLRYGEDMAPRRIAAELGIPPSTVRTRLARGLAQLRAELERRDPEGRWLASLSPVALAADGTRRAAVAAAAVALVAGLGVIGSKLLGRGPAEGGGPPPVVRPADVESEDEARLDLGAPVEGPAEPDAPRKEAAAMAAPVPTAAEPEAPAAAPSELSAPPAGTIEVLVTVGGEPLTRGEVLLALDQAIGMVRPTPGLRLGGTVPTQQRTLGPTGRVRFDGLAPGLWKVAVCLREEHSAQVTVTLPEDVGETVEVALFDNAIHGHAWDEEGVPVADAWVTLSRSRHDPRGQLTRTDANGAYRMDLVWPGPSYIGLHTNTSHPDHTNRVSPMERVTVPAEGELRHDFGSPRGIARVTARLITRGGERPVLARGITLRCDEVEGNAYNEGELSNGTGYTAELRLGEGAWGLAIDDPLDPGKRLPIQVLEVGTSDLELDVTLPGARVVVDLEGVADAEGTYLRVTRPGKNWTYWGGARAEDGRWIIDGVLPGEWDLHASDRAGARGGPVRIQVLEEDVELSATVALSR